jgi:hypothetical protein
MARVISTARKASSASSIQPSGLIRPRINTLCVYPSMTNHGRVRSTFDSSLYLDLVGDLYFRLGLYHNYDSRPPTDTPKIDYGVTTSIGWSF